MEHKRIKLSKLVQNNGQLDGVPKNPRQWKKDDVERLKRSIEETPELLQARGFIVYPLDDKYIVLGGNMRLTACKQLGHKEVDCVVLDADTTPEKLKEIVIKDNGSFGQCDFDMLANEWDDLPLSDWGVPSWDDNVHEEGGGMEETQNCSLSDKFVIPPFSVLDTRKGYWQNRKKAWRRKIGDLGESRGGLLIKSTELKYKDIYEKSRKEREKLGIGFKEYLDKYVPDSVKSKYDNKVCTQGVSLFDPVLAEILCRWFTPRKGDKIFDCFAGDTQKGLVFAECGYDFTGIELRQEQVDINNRVIEGRNLPIRYICDDGQNVSNHIGKETMDMLFSCPPYYDLEVYSDLGNDASNQGTYEEFLAVLKNAFTSALGCLRENRFAVIVVGDVRNKKNGAYYNFVDDTKRIFLDAGALLYNELILVESCASTALRASKYMDYRKVAKVHQNVLVFFKGDPKAIKGTFENIDISDDELQKYEDEWNVE